MICAEFQRTSEGYKVDAQWRGYGNADILDAFQMEGIDLLKELQNMEIGETKAYNIDWWNGCGIARRGIRCGMIKTGKSSVQ